MAQDILTKHSLLRHQTIDQEAAMYKPVREERSSKCFVFVLAAFVMCCAVLLAFASLLRLRSPEIKLRSATLNHISYNSASPSASFNATVIAHISIKNPNYGAFSYENSTVRILYAGVKVGDREIRSNRVNGRETKEMNVMVNVKSSKLPVTGNLSSDINSGTLNLTSYAKFSGTVQLLKIINKRKTIEMACIMNLNLTSHAIQGIQC
ncbi:Late embryogenesis abundant protein [Sesbania bispinosa]|nr:Late embryogenesis abundant protein [Sesbania bispinosa]